MDPTAVTATQQYEASLMNFSQYQQAAGMSLGAAYDARTALGGIDPSNQLLIMSPEALSGMLQGLQIHPLGALIDIFLNPQETQSVNGVSPQTVLLAGSLAVSQAGPNTAPVPEILNRVSNALQMPSPERER